MFINAQELIEIPLFYRENKNKTLRVLRKEEDVPEDQKKSFTKVVFKMKAINWKTYNDMQRESLIDKGTGDGEQIDVIRYKENKLVRLLSDWDAKDSSGNKIPVSQETIFNLHPIMAEVLLNEYDKRTLIGE